MAFSRFHSLLREKVEEEVDNMAGSIASGACTDYTHYREKVSYIKGLQAALKLADDIEGEKD